MGQSPGDHLIARRSYDALDHHPGWDSQPARVSHLLRPDGHVAWIGDDQQDLDDHLSRWFGKPAV